MPSLGRVKNSGLGNWQVQTGTRNTRFLRLVEQTIPKLAAYPRLAA
jgi:hypothetical protein